jgi:hypothetical protein
VLDTERKNRIIELGKQFASGWQIDAVTGGYKLARGNLVIRFLHIDRKDGDYYCRVIIKDAPKNAEYAKRTNISDDQKLLYDIEQPLVTTSLKDEARQIISAIGEFRHALHKQADEEQEASAEETFEIFNGEQSLDLENWPIVKEREVVAGFAVKNGYTLLFGDAGVGKSLLAHNIGLHAASDQRYLGFLDFLPAIKVLYLSLEMYYDEFRERHNRLLAHFPEKAKNNFVFLCPPSFDFTNQRDRALLANTIEKRGIKLLVVDSYNDWRGDKDMNDNTGIGTHIVVPLMEMMRKLDFSTILLHHTGWQGDHPTGAKILWNNASIGILMEKIDTLDGQTKLTFVKWRNTARKKPRPITLKYDPETYLVNTRATVDLEDIVDKLRLPDGSGSVTRQIMAITGLKERQAKDRKSELIKMNLLEKKGNTIHLVKMEPIDGDTL